ncbi:methyltransferase domain-containing protein [Tamlana fucoidanivorans]|uniref:Class I SAM-dependent methyltransferase n=1 Tax=Allotamlana fucoidanivorans TaxID=2583814 RepID=A0A5C4SP38_9FLAO|nr:class I SAM-dependent methyltransferase [Tamlana fucoidanivorans]TNJ45777.1 class I SAM-dependent methyltransferase [Tamlana fucoidanivorans]
MKNSLNMKLFFSCVLDYSSVMAVQVYIWLSNLLANNVNPNLIYVHLVSEVPGDFLDLLNGYGINLIKKTPFDFRNKYCSKLVQLDTFSQLEDFEYVFLMDCDTAIVDLEGLDLEAEVYAKIVDFPNPPLTILKTIFEAHQLQVFETLTTFSNNNEQVTDWNNCNGGVYIISKDFLKELKPLWEKYALWSIDNAELFGKEYDKHADQVGFALAMGKLNKKVTHLSVEWNYPIHVSNSIKVSPRIVHFHNQVNEHMQLKRHTDVISNEAIDVINARINFSLKKHLNNSLFWDYRYRTCPSLGSGVGSRGTVLELKKTLVKRLTYGREEDSIIDVGCGDLELMKNMPFKKYLGLDVSIEALVLAKKKRSDWEFKTYSINHEQVSEADITMCFDVLIHQSNSNSFKNIVRGLVEKANSRIVIGAYNDKPSLNSTITHFHNSIFDEVAAYGKFDELAIVKKYRDVSVLVGTVHNKTHQRDLSSQNLNKAFKEVTRPDLLQYVVDVSRCNLGFYTSHYPRVFEYTWILEQLENKSNLSVLDIGAGVCPIPLCLSDTGMKVTTVDLHSTIRKLKDKEKWNEWGYLDYSMFDKSIESKHQDFTKVKTFKKFDCLYSISVVEHMPVNIRLRMLKKASKLLKKNGELLLTIDIVPNSNYIWNYSEGKEVENQGTHGTIDSFKMELTKYGFKIISEHIKRDIFESKTDVWFVKSRLVKKSFL